MPGNFISRHLLLFIYVCVLTVPASASDKLFDGGHAKYIYLLNTFPDDSLFLDYVESPAVDHYGDLRLKFGWKKNKIKLAADYQLVAQRGDSLVLAGSVPGQILLANTMADDDARLFDLTRVVTESDNSYLLHRLDRLYVDFTSSKTVLRFGRQAISWGNGLIYTPMDFINPFDPAAVDKEYKTGDDMLYGQYLQNNGNDLQASWVFRRDSDGSVSHDVNTVALKYHGFAGDKEYDLLIAEHYDDMVIGAGGITNVGGAVWRGDITLTDTQTENVFSLVTSMSYSWVGWGHNVSAVLEYFYNGFGVTDGDYSPAALSQKTDLVERVLRGELFTLGRNYLAVSANVEMTPLWMLTPNVFINADDASLLAQLVSTYDFKQNWRLLAALGVPAGKTGSEYGGIDSAVPGKQLSTGWNIFAELAWYF